jgi:type I restriction enzyme, S subunit
MTWPMRMLGEVCQTTSGGTPSRSRPEYFGGSIPWVKSGDLTDGYVASSEESINELGLNHSSAKLFPAGTVLLAMYGATVGKLGILSMDAATNQAVCGITPPQYIDRLFLFYFLLSQRKALIEKSTGGAQPNISQKIVRELRLPIPPLNEQRRVVDLLSRAESIVRLRDEAHKKAAETTPALFLDMFGDPGTNPKGWPIRAVKDFVARFEGGKNLQAGDEGTTPFRILKVSAVTSGHYVESESKPAPDGYNPPTNHILRVGDMLFSRANTQELVGATAIVEATDGYALLPDKLWRFVWAEEIEQRYMHALLQNRRVRTELGKLSSGTSASMRNISQEKLFALRLPIAPLEHQRVFARHAMKLQSLRSQQDSALTIAKAAFSSILFRTFDQRMDTEERGHVSASVERVAVA